ncbi:MAG: Planctomycete cytochrome C [Verrucomicrobia bacterium]|nr:MAG: Planctomycete cytochrome C [Verrucomicrobiota bacterium]
MKNKAILASVALIFCGSTAFAVDFKKDVLPIFESSCAKCHMGGNAKGGLALDPDRIKEAIGDGASIVPSKSDSSDLIRRITMKDGGEDVMPPKSKGLGNSDVRAIREWIDAGAPLEGEGMVAQKPEAAKALQPLRGEWTNAQGKTITATLLRVEGDKALLQMPNGATYPYPIEQLSPESQSKVRAFGAPAAP